MAQKTLTNQQFLENAFNRKGPKLLNGFSRPIYHNVMGLLHGHKFSKHEFGGMIRYTEAGMLFKWASQLPPGSTIVEIGCYGGLSTCYLASGIKGKPGSSIISIDPFASDITKQEELADQCVGFVNKPTKELVAKRLEQNGFSDIVQLIEGFSQEVAKTWTKPIDFLWIDGNHDQAYQDFIDFKPFLKKGARVAVHDAHPRYGYQTVVRDVLKIFADDDKWRDLEQVKSIITGVLE